MREYAVYMMGNVSGTLYTGVTGNLVQRVHQHREGRLKGFAKRYHITQLLYVEYYGNVHEALAREKQLKGWKRKRKIALVRSANPQMRDLWNELL
jgi:putative endonuclease